MKTAAIVPAFNEAESLPDVLLEIKQAFPEHLIVVVDDGSTDGTSEIAKEFGCVCLSMPFNLGIGGALRLGFRYCKEKEIEPNSIARLVNKSLKQKIQMEAEELHFLPKTNSLPV